MTGIILGALFAAIGAGLLITGAIAYRVVAGQSGRLGAVVAAGLFAGPGMALVLLGLSLAFTDWN